VQEERLTSCTTRFGVLHSFCVKGDSRKLGFVQTNQDPIGVKPRVKAKKFVRQGNVNGPQSSKNVHKPKSVTWDMQKNFFSGMAYSIFVQNGKGWLGIANRR
jgi:hypothetical protein